MANVTMYPEYVDINHINISLTPGINDLIKDDLKLSLNDNPFSDFDLEKVNMDGTLYKIKPYLFFNIYDEVRVEVDKINYSINALKIYIAKYFYNGGGIFLYNVPKIPSGVYGLNVTQVNGEDFILTSDPITICNGINKDLSFLQTDKTIYSLGEAVNLTVNLLDEDNLNIPDGKYVIKLKLEKS